jgi:hypothetical protein
MQIALEDSLVTMSTILSSRFVAGIRPEVEKVERQLNNFSDTLDQWVQVRQCRSAFLMLHVCSLRTMRLCHAQCTWWAASLEVAISRK